MEDIIKIFQIEPDDNLSQFNHFIISLIMHLITFGVNNISNILEYHVLIWWPSREIVAADVIS